eukprot:GHVT01039467.1.p1 GENE.GHVT01039467.1~~GHVT01039467.1.p1  ORF type:complete len:297 (+),score=68.29 GHVT01039467.1:108-998(+)
MMKKIFALSAAAGVLVALGADAQDVPMGMQMPELTPEMLMQVMDSGMMENVLDSLPGFDNPANAATKQMMKDRVNEFVNQFKGLPEDQKKEQLAQVLSQMSNLRAASMQEMENPESVDAMTQMNGALQDAASQIASGSGDPAEVWKGLQEKISQDKVGFAIDRISERYENLRAVGSLFRPFIEGLRKEGREEEGKLLAEVLDSPEHARVIDQISKFMKAKGNKADINDAANVIAKELSELGTDGPIKTLEDIANAPAVKKLMKRMGVIAEKLNNKRLGSSFVVNQLKGDKSKKSKH